ncbi:hypothetical protein, partial [Xanthomonas phaseoli]|uniref:hypothetical protein n=1 Tax=Xanthomonas phaseoli TaxID=1985254 RepID=UPI00193A252A
HLTPRPLALAVVLRVAEGQLHRNRLLGSMIDCGRSGRIVQSFPNDQFVISDGQFSISFTPFSASTDVCMRAAHRNRQGVPDATADIVEALLSRVQQTRSSNST